MPAETGEPAARVIIFTMPMESHCAPEKTWAHAADMLRRRLREQYGERVELRHVELFSAESFAHEEIMALVRDPSTPPPYITVDGALIQSGGKLSSRAIRESLSARGVEPASR